MNQLRGETYCVRRDRRQAVLIHFSGTRIGELHLESERAPERRPERHRLPEEEHPRDSDRHILFRLQKSIGVILKQQFFPCAVQIRDFLLFLLLFQQLRLYRFLLRISQHFSPLAPIVGDPALFIGKRDDRPLTMVGAEGTENICFLFVIKLLHRVKADKGRFHLFLPETLLRDQGRSDRSHHLRIWRPCHFFSSILLHCPEHCVIAERSSLHDDLVAEMIQVRDTDHFREDIFDD